MSGMSRGEPFTLGIALMTSALSTILNKVILAWVLFSFGCSFIVVPIVYGWAMTWMFGSTRPSYGAIEAMPSEKYKPLLGNARSRRWIRLLDWWNGN
jgi:hypothetical protein